ncbi:MAG: DUF6456 domain-containing protein [Pseudomonadota bacterium]
MIDLTRSERSFLSRLARPGRVLLGHHDPETGAVARWEIAKLDPAGEASAHESGSTHTPQTVRASLVALAKARGWIGPAAVYGHADIGEGAAGQTVLRLTRRGRAVAYAAGLSDDIASRVTPSAASVIPETCEGDPKSAAVGRGAAASIASVRSADLATPATTIDGLVAALRADSPLNWLRARKGRDGKALISDAEIAAGERLRCDFERGEALPPVTANLSAVASGSSDPSAREHAFADRLDRSIGAKNRVQRALHHVGPELAPILMDVCCFGRPIAQVEASYGWPQRSGKVVLRIALGQLARHYGFMSGAPSGDPSAGPSAALSRTASEADGSAELPVVTG